MNLEENFHKNNENDELNINHGFHRNRFGSFSSLPDNHIKRFPNENNDLQSSRKEFGSLFYCTEIPKRKLILLRNNKKTKSYTAVNTTNKYTALDEPLSDSCSASMDFSVEYEHGASNGFEDDDPDLSDNDIIEVRSTPSSFQNHEKRKTWGMKSKSIKSPDEIPLFQEPESSDNQLFSKEADTLDAIRELDAVLDVHDESLPYYLSSSQTCPDLEQISIDNCLFDLDDYLDKIDSNCSSDYKDKNNVESKIEPENVVLHHNNNLRRTTSCLMETKDEIENSRKLPQINSIYATFRRRLPTQSEINSSVRSDVITNQTNAARLSKSTTIAFPVEVRRCFSHENCSNDQLNPTRILTQDQIFFNLIQQNDSNSIDTEQRPRQFGRRAERSFGVNFIENNVNNFCSNNRPLSAPAAVTNNSLCFPANNSQDAYTGSDTASASNSPVSIVSITDSNDSYVLSTTNVEHINNSNINENSTHPQDTSNDFNSNWPHIFSRPLALVSCTLGLFNICRFATLTMNYGGNFLIQFFILSIFFGIPFFWLQMCLGAKVKSGPVSMWKISPICCGIGISLTFLHYVIAIYSSVVVVWLLIYIGDTFTYQSAYRWSESLYSMIPRNFLETLNNQTDNAADYFNIHVLQRHNLFKFIEPHGSRLHISDRLAFYLAILWAFIFLILCKGLKSTGKTIFITTLLPFIALVVVVGKLLSTIDLSTLQFTFSSTELDDFLINSKTWIAAAQETFLTWGLLGASVIAVTSRSHVHSTINTLRKDAILVVLITLFGLFLSALMGLCCLQILNKNGFVYVPGSYEKPDSYAAIFSLRTSHDAADLISYPSKLVPHYSSFIGEVYRRPSTNKIFVSGYQVIRFVTEVFPSVASISANNISWIWAGILFISLFLLGVSQLCIMWKPISSALGNSTSAVLLSCVSGLLLSIPFATEAGISILHYMDFIIGSAWFVPILWTAEIFGVFLIRGRPYNSDDLVNDLKMCGSMSAFLALSWNILLPIGLITLSIIEYKASISSQLYFWRGKSYFSYWARKVGALTQIGFLIAVPIVALIQIYRYLSSGPPDILDRIQILYRPMVVNDDSRRNSNANIHSSYNPERQRSNNLENTFPNLQDDNPPKYTPPPSYTTATGARLAKFLRQSIRRSVRRLLREPDQSILRVPNETESFQGEVTSPPEYSSALGLSSEQHGTNPTSSSTSETIEINSRPSSNMFIGRSFSLGRKQKNRTLDVQNPNRVSKNVHAINTISGRRSFRRNEYLYTADDVITILRASTRVRGRNMESDTSQHQGGMTSNSIDNLVSNAEPLGESASTATAAAYDTLSYNGNNTSVI